MLPEYTQDQSQAEGCTHENSTCNFCVVARRSEQFVTSEVLTRTRVIESNHITVMGWWPKIVSELWLQHHISGRQWLTLIWHLFVINLDNLLAAGKREYALYKDKSRLVVKETKSVQEEFSPLKFKDNYTFLLTYFLLRSDFLTYDV